MALTRRSMITSILAAAALMTGLSMMPPACAAPAADEPIVIGHYGSLTGPEATFGKSTSNGVKLAIKEFNAAGGLNGRTISLVEYDTKGESKEAGTAVTRLATSDKVTAILGEVASSLSLAGGRVAQQYGVPMISPSSTNPEVTEIGDMVFRVCFIDPFQGYVCAKFAHENKSAKKVAVLFDQAAAYSTGLAEDFEKAFKAMGGEISSKQAYAKGDPDFTAQLTAIRSTNPDMIFVPGYYTDVGNIALQARKLGINAPLLGGDGWDSAELPKIAGKSIEGSFYCNHYSPDVPDAEVQAFIKKYQSEYNGETPDGLAALGYDAANVLFDAMKRSKSLKGKDLAAAIAATKNFKAVTGVISINKQRNPEKSAVMLEMKGNPPSPKFVATITPGEGKGK